MVFNPSDFKPPVKNVELIQTFCFGCLFSSCERAPTALRGQGDSGSFRLLPEMGTRGRNSAWNIFPCSNPKVGFPCGRGTRCRLSCFWLRREKQNETRSLRRLLFRRRVVNKNGSRHVYHLGQILTVQLF